MFYFVFHIDINACVRHTIPKEKRVEKGVFRSYVQKKIKRIFKIYKN